MDSIMAISTHSLQVRQPVGASLGFGDDMMGMEFSIPFGATPPPAVLAYIIITAIDLLPSGIPVLRETSAHDFVAS